VVTYPGATGPVADRREYYVVLLDYCRAAAISRVGALSAGDQVSSTLVSGWTPLSLLKHLAFVEMRWLEWGFDGVAVESPFADRLGDQFVATSDESFVVLADALMTRGAMSRRIVTAHDLDEIGQPSERWDGEPPPTLERVLQHLAYEYARHLGHLDIVVEMATGTTGE
jgi:hypothetical protein